MQIEPIAIVRSCYPDKFGTPRQPGLVKHSWARIEFKPEMQPEESLQGLEGFTHLWIIFEFHKNKSDRFHAKVHPPRLGGQTMGVFATRSPHRPNPIGLSLVEIVRVEKDGVVVSGIDLIEGTPVLDIKPYLPEIEAVPLAKNGWTDQVPKKEIQISWTEDQLQEIQAWSKKIGQPNLRDLIEETLQQDPRPTVYKGYEGGESPYRSNHAVRFFDGDVHFEFTSPTEIRILKVITQS
ncbi:MAG: tRNA (N6-threonylcarbamoyladenosine(37)-N6)-methyltransferase TrmO [Oligoflexia bacterium]|nr:MAG: tRNA (N6-threonylcarbamoyladenosine(37)-N6)-methyltransferase TrmO [Oligoflexia bacterium]